MNPFFSDENQLFLQQTINFMQTLFPRYNTETTQCEFKEALETKKAKSWLKTVSAFANGVGGSIIFGVRDTDKAIVGVEKAQETVRKLSELIQARIKPQPQIEIHSFLNPAKSSWL